MARRQMGGCEQKGAPLASDSCRLLALAPYYKMLRERVTDLL
jgi:hypothetical protein